MEGPAFVNNLAGVTSRAMRVIVKGCGHVTQGAVGQDNGVAAFATKGYSGKRNKMKLFEVTDVII
jgi:hypothetical protein